MRYEKMDPVVFSTGMLFHFACSAAVWFPIACEWASHIFTGWVVAHAYVDIIHGVHIVSHISLFTSSHYASYKGDAVSHHMLRFPLFKHISESTRVGFPWICSCSRIESQAWSGKHPVNTCGFPCCCSWFPRHTQNSKNCFLLFVLESLQGITKLSVWNIQG